MRANSFFLAAVALIAAAGLSPALGSSTKTKPVKVHASATPVAAPSANKTPVALGHRVTSIYVSQDFINEELVAHMKAKLLKEMKIELNAEHDLIYLRGILQIPTEEMRAINLDPKLGAYRFQLTIKPETTPDGYLILDFPLNETFFYPASSKDPVHDRVFVPVQMLSLALASARGYFAALGGDYSSFDRRAAKLKALIRAADRSVKEETNADALDELKTQREADRVQLEALPIERKQMEAMAKKVGGMMGFMGEKELNLNNELAARKNALIIKIDLAKFTPFLQGVELGGVRIIHNFRDGGKVGENYLSIDVNAQTAVPLPPDAKKITKETSGRPGLPVAPAAILRLNQALFESDMVVNAEKKKMGSKLSDLDFELKEDGLHVAGVWHGFFLSIPFDAIADFVTTATDKFEIRVRDVEVAHIDFEFLTGFILDAMKNRLDKSLKGICTFQYVGVESDHSRALEVTVNAGHLIPALAGLHLIDVDVREKEFLLKIGRID